MKRLNVLVLTSTFPRWVGDVEPGFVYQLCKRLQQDRDVNVLAPHFPGALRSETIDGLSVNRFPYWMSRWQTLAYQGGILNRIRRNPFKLFLIPAYIVSLAYRARRLIKCRSIHTIHAHWILPQGLAAILACTGLSTRPALLCTSHGSDWYWGRRRILLALNLWVLRRMDAITVVSDAMRRSMISSGVDPKKIQVLPMGVDLRETFVPDRSVAREACRLLFVGRLVDNKGLEYLFQAMVGLHEHHPDLMLDIVGWGPAEDRLRTIVKALGLERQVVFLGAVSNEKLPQLYRKATLAVFPFIQEGLGLVTVEALGCECPVVVSGLEPVRELVEHDVTGLLTKPRDGGDLAEKIHQGLTQPHHMSDLARRGRERLLQRFDWDVIVGRYARLMDSLASKYADE